MNKKNIYRNAEVKFHRADGPIMIEFADGSKGCYLKGKRHREDGPAIEYTNGHKEWYLNDKLHREDGPAVEFTNGNKEWYLDDKMYTKQNYYRELIKRGLMTYEDAVLEML